MQNKIEDTDRKYEWSEELEQKITERVVKNMKEMENKERRNNLMMYNIKEMDRMNVREQNKQNQAMRRNTYI